MTAGDWEDDRNPNGYQHPTIPAVKTFFGNKLWEFNDNDTEEYK